jgi:hypothetical protein
MEEKEFVRFLPLNASVHNVEEVIIGKRRKQDTCQVHDVTFRFRLRGKLHDFKIAAFTETADTSIKVEVENE